jgi:hypothetical protein
MHYWEIYTWLNFSAEVWSSSSRDLGAVSEICVRRIPKPYINPR